MGYFFWIVAIVVSIYHGWRGYVMQRIAVATEKQDLVGSKQFFWSDQEVIWGRYVYDVGFYFFSSVTGFFCLWLANEMMALNRDIPPGNSAVLIFLAAIGFLGVTGHLAYMIQHGKLPKS